MHTHLEHFNAARPRLLSVAYRMTGSLADSEDILQDAWLKFAQLPAEKIGSAAALLTTIVTRLSLDLLRSARKKRETYVGPWLPEPVPDLYLAHEDATQRETVSYAFLLLLEKLNPVERAVFVLREIFDYDYAEIAAIVRKNGDHCRQVFHRAKKALRKEHKPRHAPGAHEQQLLAAFLAACAGNDLGRLAGMLGHDAVMLNDGGGKVSASSIPILGPSRIAKFIFAVRDKGGRKEYYSARLNNAFAVVVYADGLPYALQVFDFSHDRVGNSYVIRNPDKLVFFRDKQALLKNGVLEPVSLFIGLRATLQMGWRQLLRRLSPGRK
ncbi:MAG: RNA polymerase sigma factor SigJ [Turneriella sp.]